MTTNQSNKASRLEYQIKIFVKFLTIVAFIVGLVSFIVGGFNRHWTNVIPLLVTSFTVCAVAMIPEGKIFNPISNLLIFKAFLLLLLRF
jgi:magnesium-transporting ATPase (P-type)